MLDHALIAMILCLDLKAAIICSVFVAPSSAMHVAAKDASVEIPKRRGVTYGSQKHTLEKAGACMPGIRNTNPFVQTVFRLATYLFKTFFCTRAVQGCSYVCDSVQQCSHNLTMDSIRQCMCTAMHSSLGCQ